MASENSAYRTALERAREQWFTRGDEHALAQLLGALRSTLIAPTSLVAALGSAEISDAREAVLIRLLDRSSGALREAESPLALAQVAFRRALLDQLRARARSAQASTILATQAAVIDAEGAWPFEALVLAERAQRAAAALSALTAEQRAAVVLLVCPHRLPAADRAVLRGLAHGEALPVDAVSAEAASSLLFGTAASETKAEREQRVNRFHHLRARALAAMRRHLADEEAEPE